MKIDFVEIRNFRRLESVRIDFSDKTTLFVGANNSGKTSAITAIRYFLKHQNAFSPYDIPLALWSLIDEMGEVFEKGEEEPQHKWNELLPSLDVWLKVKESEIHHVSHLIPTLEWSPDQGIGVRLQLEPKDPAELLATFVKLKKAACETLKTRQKAEGEENPGQDDPAGTAGTCKKFALWPESLMDYLKRRMSGLLKVNAYLLDPSKKAEPRNGVAQPQSLPDDAEPLDDDPFKDLIKINEVPAHRDLSDYSEEKGEEFDGEKGRKQILTTQLQRYYGKHLDPLKGVPEPSDIKALEAIHEAQLVFNERLKECFELPLCELEQLGYPGVANPRLIFSTSFKPVEGLKHQSAVQYDVVPQQGNVIPYRLPEQCNGLGYQNLISMVFRLISYRDDWLKVGKAARKEEETGIPQVSPPPLHLVLLEEPEAHLHVQVQQVFIRKAYEILCRGLQDSSLSTQLVVSTHSSHIAHEVDFAQMRYFRRHPTHKAGKIPISTVINLSEVFGEPDETARFVKRYLQATHADLFFADGAIMVEGAAERMLIPHFIRGSSLLSVGELKDSTSLAVTLREASDPLSLYLRGLFSPETQQLLSEYDETGSSLEPLQNALIQELNQLLQGPSLHDEDRFDHVTLSQKTQQLIKQSPVGEDLIRLNRLLLEEAYPHKIANSYQYSTLYSSYITLLEVGGSHAHRLAPLIEHLGLNTLIITDIDAVDETTRKKVRPAISENQITSNNVLKEWHPQQTSIDGLANLSEELKERVYDDFFSIRVAYQVPINVSMNGQNASSVAVPRTFEDSLVMENIDFFRRANGLGLIAKFREVIQANSNDVSEMHKGLLDVLDKGSKAEFALDLLFSEDLASINVPSYIDDGLRWLEMKILQRQQEVLITEAQVADGTTAD